MLLWTGFGLALLFSWYGYHHGFMDARFWTVHDVLLHSMRIGGGAQRTEHVTGHLGSVLVLFAAHIDESLWSRSGSCWHRRLLCLRSFFSVFGFEMGQHGRLDYERLLQRTYKNLFELPLDSWPLSKVLPILEWLASDVWNLLRSSSVEGLDLAWSDVYNATKLRICHHCFGVPRYRLLMMFVEEVSHTVSDDVRRNSYPLSTLLSNAALLVMIPLLKNDA
jgi:hypothetical protein